MSNPKSAGLHEVTVLMPHGHRVVVRVPPQTPLVKVLDIACNNTWKKVDASSLALRRPGQRNELDLTVSLQYSALPNCAQLEAVTAAKGKRVEKPCSVALQVPGKSRLVADFLLDTKVWDVLRHWDHLDSSLQLTNRFEAPSPGSSQSARGLDDDGSSSDIHGTPGKKEPRRELVTLQLPCCRYMRSEINTLETLRGTSLRDFGIAGNRALISVRFLRTNLTPADVGPDVGPSVAPPGNDNAPGGVAATVSTTGVARPSGAVDMPGTATNDTRVRDIGATDSSTHAKGSDTMPATETRNVFKSDPVGPPVEAVSKALPPNSVNVGKDSDATNPVLALDSFQTAPSGAALQPFPQASQSAMTHTTTAAPLGKGPSVYALAAHGKMKATPSAAETTAEEAMVIPDRNYIVYARPKTQAVTPAEVPDDFYNLTSADLVNMLKDCKTSYSPSEQPLLTKALRQKLKDEKEAKYKYARIRVYFPDDYILEVSMHPKESIPALMQCVRDCLDNTSAQFYLYTTPPKRTLPDGDITATLSTQGLVPSANVRLGFHGGDAGASRLREALTAGAENKHLFTPAQLASTSDATKKSKSDDAGAGTKGTKSASGPKGGLQFLKGLSKR